MKKVKTLKKLVKKLDKYKMSNQNLIENQDGYNAAINQSNYFKKRN